MPRKRLASILIRIGLAFTFLYASVLSYFEPDSWIGYFPILIRDLLPANVILAAFSIYEVILALWLISGKHIFQAALISAITIFAIIIANIGIPDIIFRDIGLFMAAISLALLEKQNGANS